MPLAPQNLEPGLDEADYATIGYNASHSFIVTISIMQYWDAKSSRKNSNVGTMKQSM